jgi:hypothetical protein
MANTTGGVGLPSILTIVFVVLKLTDTVQWSWWWVFSPLLIAFGLYVIMIMFIVLVSVFLDR